MKDLSSQLLKFLATVAKVETYDIQNSLVKNGDSPDSFDFLYVASGRIDFHLVDQFKLKTQTNYITASNKSLHQSSSAIYRVETDDFIDSTYLTRRKLPSKHKEENVDTSRDAMSNLNEL